MILEMYQEIIMGKLNNSRDGLMKSLLKWFVASIIFVVIACIVFIYIRTRDRHPGYKVDLWLPEQQRIFGQLQAGFAALKITPDLPDRWTDTDTNTRFEPEKGDTYVDGNKNGKFDAYWLAGFDNKRAANGIHDDIWARAVVLDDSASVVGLVVLDAIGFFNDDVITVRKMVAERIPEIDHIVISSTHSHEVPDLMGLWGESEYVSGVNPEYRKMVQVKAADAICEAFKNRRPARLEFASVDSVEKDLVDDGRPPYVYDCGIRLLKVSEKENGNLMGMLVNFANHPETAGSKNLLITSDFVHYLRDGIEQGIFYGNEKKREGAGGMVIYMNGAVGGLLSGMGCSTYDPWTDSTYAAEDNSFDKVRAQGYRLADKVLEHLETGTWRLIGNPSITLRAKSFHFPIRNKYFKLGTMVGVLDRSFFGLRAVRSEVDLLTIGPAWFLTLPGEVNPEIINGGIETPAGRDFEVTDLEVPPVRELMKGDINFVIGLANDEVGYIMPKSHWDEEPPYTYGEKEAPYGEINSLGPETGPELYKQVSSLVDEMLNKDKEPVSK